MIDEFDNLNKYLKKKKISYSEFNYLIGNYFVESYEEFEENYYLINIIRPLKEGRCMYTDYIEVYK
ncbi:MAG: hypothetical protein ACRDA3_04880 [Peptostreptococcaceae bacterium]